MEAPGEAREDAAVERDERGRVETELSWSLLRRDARTGVLVGCDRSPCCQAASGAKTMNTLDETRTERRRRADSLLRTGTHRVHGTAALRWCWKQRTTRRRLRRQQASLAAPASGLDIGPLEANQGLRLATSAPQ